MLCSKCNQNQATIHLHLNINGQAKSMPLCKDCYTKEKLGSFQGNLFNKGGMDSFFGPFHFNEPIDSGHSYSEQTQTPAKPGFLDQFGRNLNQAAKTGLIDPIIGREEEINRTIEILNRRNKNNPVLIGEPGVGKTAIAEGLALKIVENKVPEKLKNKEVYLMDVASLVSNTGIRGQFEERMKKLIHELQAKKNVLLFIDEIHLLVGAGSAEGSMDAGNILKPALARGELQVIGATTLVEYRQIEKDAALERRFQPVQVGEPSVERSIEILNGIKEKYESYHQVQYTSEAIKACVELSHRYIQDRFLPDKAIDLMDEAGSKLNLTIAESGKEAIEHRLVEIDQLKKQALHEENYELAAQLRDEEETLEKKLNITTHSEKVLVDIQHIQEIVESKTGIPVGKLQSEEQLKLKELEKRLASKVIGQDEAVNKVAKAIRRSRAGLKAKNRPIGSFLFVGPTGVGKTELTKTLAEELFGTKNAFIRLDMSEYMEKHSISKLIGSPPGYVGHEEAGQLTEKVRRNPYSIILLDEIEKAHPDVQHMFLQILEDGRLTDSQGKTVSFKDTVIIMTSNAGTNHQEVRVGFDQSGVTAETNILKSLGSFFKSEFLNRFDNIIEFNSLKSEHLLKIVDLLIEELQAGISEQGIRVTVTDQVKQLITELGNQPAFGARPLRRVIQEQLEDKIADFILDHSNIKHLHADVVNGTILVTSKHDTMSEIN